MPVPVRLLDVPAADWHDHTAPEVAETGEREDDEFVSRLPFAARLGFAEG